MTDYNDPRNTAQADQDLDAVRTHLATSSSAIQATMVALVTAPNLLTCDQVLAQVTALEAVVRRLRVQLAQNGSDR